MVVPAPSNPSRTMKLPRREPSVCVPDIGGRVADPLPSRENSPQALEKVLAAPRREKDHTRFPKEASMARSEEILSYWFGPGGGDGWTFSEERLQLWFGKSAEVDEEIRARFGGDLDAAIRGELDDWTATPRGRLALLILLDQFSRHVFRGSPKAFAQDPKAQGIVLEGLERGDHRAIRPMERSFFYLPLEHAEDLALQERSVQLFRELADESPQPMRERYLSFLDYAERHEVIIRRFGRFPHRNLVLGRESTEEEEAFLLEPGSSF